MKVFLERKECLSQAEIMGYCKEEFEESKQYELETHLVDCKLCSTAVETCVNKSMAGEMPELEDWSSFKQQLKPMASPNKIIKSETSNFNHIAAAAIIFLIATSGVLYWNHSKGERSFHKYEQAFDFTQDGFSFRGIEEEKTDSKGLLSAIELFNEKAYAESLRELDVFLAQQPENVVASFYKGMNALKLSKTEEAIHHLSICRINGELYYEDATWYLALAHLQKGDQKESLAILKELRMVKNGFYLEELERLIKELEE